MYIWKQTGQCRAVLEHIQRLQGDQHNQAVESEVRKSLQQLTAAVDNLRVMAKAYVFYDVHLDGDQALAIDRPASKGPPESASN